MSTGLRIALCLWVALLGCEEGTPALRHSETDVVETSPSALPVSCSVTDDGARRQLVCSDGTQVTWSVGDDGIGCSVTTADGQQLLCEDGTGGVFPESSDGVTCTVSQEDDGSATLHCSDGTSLTLLPGADEPALGGGVVAGSASRYGDPDRSGIRVTLVETGQVLTTDELGEFSTAELPLGYYTLRFESDGYTAQTLSNVGVLGSDRFLEEVVLRRGVRAWAEGNLELTSTAPSGGVFLFQRMAGDFGRSLFFAAGVTTVISNSTRHWDSPEVFWRNDGSAVIFEDHVLGFEPLSRRLWDLGENNSGPFLDPTGEWLLNGGIRRVADGSVHSVIGSYHNLAFAADGLTLFGQENGSNRLYAIDCATGVGTEAVGESLATYLPSAVTPSVVLATVSVGLLQKELIEFDTSSAARLTLVEHTVSGLFSPRGLDGWLWLDGGSLWLHERATRTTTLLDEDPGSYAESPGGVELLVRAASKLSLVDLASRTATPLSADYKNREPLEALFVNDDLLVFREASSQPSTPDGTLVVYEVSTATRSVLTDQASTELWQVSPSTNRVAFREAPSGELFVFDRTTAELHPTGLIAAPKQWRMAGEDHVVALAPDSESHLWLANLVTSQTTLLDDSVSTLEYDGQALYYTLSQPAEPFERRRDGLWTLGVLP